jgi:hypothetical protein
MQWWNTIVVNQREEFDKLVNQWFGLPLHSNALGELIQLHHESTITEYQSRFLALVSRCQWLIEKHQVDIFTASHDNPLKIDVEIEHLTTLKDAMALARTYEKHLADDSSAHTTPLARATPTKPLLLIGPPSATSPKGTARPTPPRFKCLTPVEMAAKRERGECYNCTKKFLREHLKVCPVKGVFLL